MNYFSLKTFVSRFQIAASIAKIAATGLVIGTGFYLLIFKGTEVRFSNEGVGLQLNFLLQDKEKTCTVLSRVLIGILVQ